MANLSSVTQSPLSFFPLNYNPFKESSVNKNFTVSRHKEIVPSKQVRKIILLEGGGKNNEQ